MNENESRFINTKGEVYKLVVNKSKKFNFENLQEFITNSICKELSVSRNLTSQYLNDFFKEGKFIKINSRPVYFFDKKSIENKFGKKIIKNEYDDLNQLFEYLKDSSYGLKNFDKAIGNKLGLRSVIEKSIIAMDYPPIGLPLILKGEEGVGKSYISYLAYEYSLDNKLIDKDTKYIIFNCLEYEDDLAKAELELLGDKENEIIGLIQSEIFLFIKNFYLLGFELQKKVVNNLNKRKARIIFSSIDKKLDELLSIEKKIPISVKIPSLSLRSVSEKEALIINFMKIESKNIQKSIEITENAYFNILEYNFTDNINELKDCIQKSCAKAFSIDKEKQTICITLFCLPEYIINKKDLKISSLSEKNKILNLNDLVISIGFYKEEKLLNSILYKCKDLIDNKIDFNSFYDKTATIIDSYHDNIIFNKDLLNERSRIIEQTIVDIFEHIRDFYNVNFASSFIVSFSRCVYNNTRQYYSIQNWESKNKDLLLLIQKNLKNKLPKETIIARDIINLIEKNLDIKLNLIEEVILYISLRKTRISFDTLPIQAFIICHGYATASSIADVCNKITGRYVFNAIDMPFDTPVSSICNQVRRILYYSDNRDIVFLVDLGSLEQIINLLDDIPNVNLGIMNNVSTSSALHVATSIMQGKSIREIFESENDIYKTSYQIIEKSKREEAIIFVSESSSKAAEKVSKLFLESIPNNINVNILSYDYETFLELQNNKQLEKYNILFIASTVYLKTCKYPLISIEDIITFKNTTRLNKYLSNYLEIDDIKIFNQNILNNFSLQNVIESLTILNAKKVLSIVNEMLEKLQISMQSKFSAKTVIGLNIHISCLIERLVKKEEINTHIDYDDFINNYKYYINIIQDSFKHIKEQYNIDLPISEIIYVYDYIKHDKDKNDCIDENF